MKVLFFGSNGWLGGILKEMLLSEQKQEIEVIDANIRANNSKEVEALIKEHLPTHIISTIGRTHGGNINSIDYLEQEGKLKENINDNLYAPCVLALLARRYDIHFTYIGTGCIFNNDTNMSDCYKYKEEDEADYYGSSYSIVKGFTDNLMKLIDNHNVLNLRIRMPIVNYHHSRNFITKIVNYPKISSMPNSMTVIETLFPFVIDMMMKKTTGTFNLVNPGVMSHNQILELYKEHIDPNLTWTNITIEEQNSFLKSKRSNNHLDTTKLLELYPEIPDIKTAIHNTIMEMKNKKI